MSKFWSKTVRMLEPYVPGEQPKDRKYIKLNTNENPYPPSPKVIEAMEGAVDENLRLYPDPNCDELKETVAFHYGLRREQVFVGNGSDEVLAFSFAAFFDPGTPILFPEITYTFYPVYCRLYDINYETVPLDDNFDIPVETLFRDNGGIIFANPNAPTGKYMDIANIEEILRANMDRVVIIDEAYIDFGGDSAVSLIHRYPNLLVVRTLSKSHSLAGLRVGFALGHEDLIEGLERVKNSFNSYTLDRVALAGAVESIRDTAYFNETRSKIMKTRGRVSEELKNIGFKVIDSKANFIFVSHPDTNAAELFAGLREKGILVRYFNKPLIDNFLRISIGSDYEMDCLITALKEILM